MLGPGVGAAGDDVDSEVFAVRHRLADVGVGAAVGDGVALGWCLSPATTEGVMRLGGGFVW